MSASLIKRVRELEAAIEELMAGNIYQRSALGPGAMTKNIFKAKSITASMLDVSDLASVSTKTGTLTLTGSLTAGSGSSAMGYDPNHGIYLGNPSPPLAPFRVTPTGAMTAQNASVTGVVTANTLTANGGGQIAGWNIDNNKLSRGNVGLGDASGYRIWSGNLSSPSLADFSVDNSGNLKAQAGQVASWSIAASTLSSDSGNVGLGQSGNIRLWAGGAAATAPFRVEFDGKMTATSAAITGSVNATNSSFSGSVTTSNLDANGGTMGGLDIDGTLKIVTGGQILIGDASANRIVINGSGITGYSSATVKEFEVRTSDGRGVFGGGYASIDSNGVNFVTPLASANSARAVNWRNASVSGSLDARICAVNSGSVNWLYSEATVFVWKPLNSSMGELKFDTSTSSLRVSSSANVFSELSPGTLILGFKSPNFLGIISDTYYDRIGLDCAELSFPRIASRNPTNGSTPSGWMKVIIGGAERSIPLYT